MLAEIRLMNNAGPLTRSANKTSLPGGFICEEDQKRHALQAESLFNSRKVTKSLDAIIQPLSLHYS